MDTLKAGLVYFLLVFAAGFVLGFARVLWIAPLVGTRGAELAEVPVMLVVTILAARRVVRRFAHDPRTAQRLGSGMLALGLMVITELAVGLWLQGITFDRYVAGRDPLTGTVYIAMLIVYALMPLAVGRRR